MVTLMITILLLLYYGGKDKHYNCHDDGHVTSSSLQPVPPCSLGETGLVSGADYIFSFLLSLLRCYIQHPPHLPLPLPSPPLHCGLLPFSTSLQIPVGFSLHNRPVYVVFSRLRFMWFRFLFMTIEFQTDDRQVQKGHGASLHINQLRQRKKR